MIDTKVLLTLLLEFLPVLYGVAFFNYVLVFATEEHTVRRLARPLLVTAVAANLLYMLAFTFFFEHIPLVTVQQVLGAVGFAVAVIYLWVESRTGSLYTGPFILFLVLVFQIVNTLFPKLDSYVPDILSSALFSFHVSAAVLGYSAFAVAAVFGLLYLLLYHQIRAKSFGLVFRRLPSLDILDRMNFYAAIAGFAMLTLAIVLGAIWSEHVPASMNVKPTFTDPKVLVAVGTWLFYGLAILGRQFVSWRGPRLAYSSLVGFVIVLASMFVVNYVFTNFHMFAS